MDKSECQRTRELIACDDKSSSSEFLEMTSTNPHLTTCQDCRSWAEQSSKISSLTRELTQYDVPESVTQSILQAVARESKPSFGGSNYIMFVAGAALMGLAAFVLSESSENLEGLIAWSLGLAIIMIIHLTSTRVHTHRAIHQ